MKKLENKVALVTGGSRGIGEAIAYALAKEGADIGLGDIADKEQTERVCESIRKKYGVKAIAIKADVSVPEEVQAMVDAMLKRFGKIDILVNNAGITSSNKLVDTSLEEWNRVIGVDLTGVFLCTKAVLPFMLSRREGRIINISSTNALLGRAGRSAYAAAKGGVIAFTKSIARELIQDGILVNCVAPGPTDTAMISLTLEGREAIGSFVPLGRISLPEEIATTVVFLATSDSNVYVGQTLCPNGGEFMI